MNSAISFFVGCLTLVLMMIIKIPIKKMVFKLSWEISKEEKQQQMVYKRLNSILIVCVMLVSVVCYYLVLMVLGEEHFKLCCSVKAGAIAVALYAVLEQWFGDDMKL